MAARFAQLSTERIGEGVAERVRRSHHDAIGELQRRVRALEGEMSRACVGLSLITMSGGQTVSATDTAINLDTLSFSNMTGLVTIDESSAIRLAPGYAYRCQAGIYVSGSGEEIGVQWRDLSEGAYVGLRGDATVNNTGVAYSNAHIAVHVFDKITSSRRVALWAYAITGTPTTNTQRVWCTVEAYAKP